MKRVIGLVFVCGMACCVSDVAAAPSSVRPHVAKSVAKRAPSIYDLAPADQYFGPLKLSILGIRNTIRDLGARYDVNHAVGHGTFTSAELTERSIRDWEHHFPRDGQVPKAIYLLQRLYTKVLTQESRDRAHATAVWLFADYASSPQGRQLKKTLAVEHLAPIPLDTPTPAVDVAPSSAGDVAPPSSSTPAAMPDASSSPSSAPTTAPLLAQPSSLPTATPSP